MQITDEIVELLSSQTPSVENALFKAQVLAHRLGENGFKDWVEHELKGYSKDDALPGYRIVPIAVMGNFSNGAYRYTDQAVPLLHLDEKLRKKLEVKHLRESIAVIEQWSKDESSLSVVIAPEFYPLLSKGLGNGYEVERAWGKNSMGAMLQVVTEVRSRLLELALQLSDTLPAEASGAEMKQLSKDVGVRNLFRNAVFGDNVTINIGSGQITGVTNAVTSNDFESLAALLKESGISDNDITELRTSVELDKTSQEVARQELGPRVRAWIGTMVAKAGSSGWRIGIGAAGSLLARALAQYYGFGA